MSITIRPDGSIITDTAAEAVAFLKEQQIAGGAPYQCGGVSDPDGFLMRPNVAETIRTALSSSGLATESTATTATGVVEGGPVDDEGPAHGVLAGDPRRSELSTVADPPPAGRDAHPGVHAHPHGYPVPGAGRPGRPRLRGPAR